MPLSPGTRLGPYEILSPLGAGGMGEVYRAKDTKLGRDVAIKVLPATLAQDPERLARFEREAKVLASLNHPNIAQIYGVEESNVVRALVMELVPGENLAFHVKPGPLPLETALNYAKQIAEAFEAAHDKGITHRDLKPANIMVTPEGVVKMLDFGLAAVALGSSSDAGDPANSPTLTMGATQAGTIMGTAAYMSPEQASGKAVDKRADIWSFGVVLFEMLTGKRLFDGETISHTLADVLRGPIDFTKLPPKTPAKIRDLLKRCLERNVKNRLRDIGEARIVIGEAIQETSSGASQEAEALSAAPQRRILVPWAVAGVLALISIGLGTVLWRLTQPVDRPLLRLSVDLGPDAGAGQFSTTVISPDGSRLVFPIKSSDGKQMLATRLLSETKPALLSGTNNGSDSFFSPDGKWIGFFADSKMKKIPVQGGAPVVLCDASDARGAGWGEHGDIVVALNSTGALSRVPIEGGTPRPVTKLQGALTHRWPQLLPGGESALFTLSSSIVAFEDASIAAVSLKTGEVKILVRGGYFGRYLPTGDSTGHLLYVHEGVLFAAPFDPARLELRGTAVPMLEDLAADPTSGAGQFSFSGAPSGPGTLVYRAGKASAQSWPVSWLEKSGKAQPLIATPGFYLTPRFSPDGRRLALAQTSGNDRNIFIYDLQRDTMSRLTLNTQTPAYPTWSPDGKHIVFWFRSADGFSLGWIRADGSGEIQHLLDSKNVMVPYSFFPDGRRLAYSVLDPDNGYDLWTVALDLSDPDHPKPDRPELFLHTPSNERYPAVSPDGRWIAYQSDESGRNEVDVRPFPGPGGKWQISNAGGQLPVWSHDGRELFFQSLDNRIIVADCEPKNESFVAGKPRLWSDQQLRELSGILSYDLAPDGQRFAIFPELKGAGEEKGDVHMSFLENFFDELRRRAPAGK